MADARLILAAVVLGALAGCAQKTERPRPVEAVDSENRQARDPEQREARETPIQPTIRVAPEAAAPEPGEPTPEAAEASPRTDGPPSWWLVKPRWEGARVTVAAAHFGKTILAARMAAVESGELELAKALGRRAEQVEVTRVQVAPEGNGYRAYVLMVGE